MSRSIVLPVLGLLAVVIFGLTRARPLDAGPAEPSESYEWDVPTEPPPAPPAPPPPPPPAPRLRSDIEAEERASATPADTAQSPATDTARVGPASAGYLPAAALQD